MHSDNFSSLSPVFLLGIARSGTTLLQSLLDGHPSLLVDVGDSQFPRFYKDAFRWDNVLRKGRPDLKTRFEMATSKVIDHYFNQPSTYYQNFLISCSIAELKDNFKKFLYASEAAPKDFIESYFHALGLASGYLGPQTRYWVDKTLSHEYLVYRYAHWWPNTRFIYVVRDPRDIYTSYKKRDIKNNRLVTPIETFALTWSDSVHALLYCQKTLPPENRYILHYEDLVKDPEGTMQAIADFLHIEFIPSLLTPTKGFGKVAWGGNPESGKRQTGVIYKDAASKWRNELTPDEIARLDGLLWHEMRAVGYPAASPAQFFPLSIANIWARRMFFRFLNLGL